MSRLLIRRATGTAYRSGIALTLPCARASFRTCSTRRLVTVPVNETQNCSLELETRLCAPDWADAQQSESLLVLRTRMQDYINMHPKDFEGVSEKGEMNLVSFGKLISHVIPDMGQEEIKALFVSMDASKDELIQFEEIFSDMTLKILANRMEQVVTHPLEGSYYCLPTPPFHPDPKQLAAISKLKHIYDEVIAAHAQPLPPIQRPPPVKEEKNSGGGIFSSMFGGFTKTKAPEKKCAPKAPPEFIPKPNAAKGAYLYGGVGCGKTVLLDIFFRSLPEGFSARRLHWHEFIRDAFRAMQGHPAGENIFVSMADMMASQFRVLLLDELVITHISEAILVKNLFRHMWARGMTIIATSNYLPGDLYSKGFNRDQFVPFMPELESQCPLIDMTNDKDYRQVGLQADESFFFTPLDSASSASFEKALKHVIGPNLATNVSLPIPHEKRSITVPVTGQDARGASVARLSFDDLCVNNMGRADYSVLAEQYHTIFIEAVPKYKPDLGAEFRRFVSLVDILYGKKVAVYLQSEVPTKELFASSAMNADLDLDELIAFRRCSSMLGEMQSPKYHLIVWLMRNHMLQETASYL
eukprot:TRINITY_DN11418_c0_g1_i1.p1 TRINITY_DN11418_c0_g1~~TRINITY_DN11418_c0_g1_i1.p1  ORF type:complete len:584 (+),score=66.54 TRINITY_DN11418_c0_g1_i1:56-1807(+)